MSDKKKKSELTAVEADKILRVVPHSEAFYFFTGIGEYTGDYAVSLDDFYYKLKDLEQKSVLFHLHRGDFEKWIKETIGDTTLADEIGNLETFTGEELRTKMRQKVGQRLSQLKNVAQS